MTASLQLSEARVGFLRAAMRHSTQTSTLATEIVHAALRVAALLYPDDYCASEDLRKTVDAIITVAEDQLAHESMCDVDQALALLERDGLTSLLGHAKDRLDALFVLPMHALSLDETPMCVAEVQNPLLSLERGRSRHQKAKVYRYVIAHDRLMPEAEAVLARAIVGLWKKLAAPLQAMGFVMEKVSLEETRNDHTLLLVFMVYRLLADPDLPVDGERMALMWRRKERQGYRWTRTDLDVALPECNAWEKQYLLDQSEALIEHQDGIFSVAPGSSLNLDTEMYGKATSLQQIQDAVLRMGDREFQLRVLQGACGMPENSDMSLNEFLSDYLALPDIHQDVFVARGMAVARRLLRNDEAVCYGIVESFVGNENRQLEDAYQYLQRAMETGVIKERLLCVDEAMGALSFESGIAGIF